MKKLILTLATTLIVGNYTAKSEECFIASEHGKIVTTTGKSDCNKRHSPCSTFKIAISLMGFDSGILTSRNAPKWPFKKWYVDWYTTWKQSQTPITWIANSCVWYSQLITQKLGSEQFEQYVKSFDYGNKDVSGSKGKDNRLLSKSSVSKEVLGVTEAQNQSVQEVHEYSRTGTTTKLPEKRRLREKSDGLTNSWLCSSLKISPKEQVEFLQKLTSKTLPVSQDAQKLTKDILFIDYFADGWQLYGKTGGGPTKDNKIIGWFVGWIEKSEHKKLLKTNRRVIFAEYVEGEDKIDSNILKEKAKQNLLKVIRKR